MIQHAVFEFDCFVSDRRKLYFVFDGLFSVKHMLLFPLIVTLVISARSILCSKGESWRYFLLEIPISRNCLLVKWLKCLQLLNWCLIRA